MFSEYASRFLAQSQSRISYRPEDAPRNGSDGQRRSNRGTSRFPPSRSYLHRAIGNPYQPAASQASHFPFASRTSAQPAPLFYSATDEFREEDDEQEHEREIADFYALQRSRRHLGASRLQESSEMDDDEDEDEDGKSSVTSGERHTGNHNRNNHRPKGIRSSWRGGKSSGLGRGFDVGDPLSEQLESERDDSRSETSSSAKDKMVDVGLEDTMRTNPDNQEDHAEYGDDDPPSIQHFRKQPDPFRDHFQANSSFLPRETDTQGLLDDNRPPSSGGSSVPPPMAHPDPEPPHHDAFWGNCFLICLVALFSTSFLVWLHTSAPARKPGLGDTVYTTLHGSFFLLAVYTLVSVLVSLLWLALLRSYVRPLVYGMLVAVPVILYSFSLYPFISSFSGTYHGSSIQDKAMRWGSIVPAVMATGWVYTVIKGRHSATKAISILEFACRILSANPALLVHGFMVLGLIVSWTWMWMFMFTRVFLGGHASKTRFIIDASSWWLGAYFILVYIWSLGVIAGIQRAVTAATVSQWYFHRLAVPAPTSRQIVQAALTHATTTLFGTICLSSLLSMLIRLPLIILPRRLSSFITLAAYSLVPTPIAALTSPLTLTYAAIHSQPLGSSARGLGQMTFLSPTTPATTLHPRSFSSAHNNQSPLVPYRLAKLLLHATRFMMSLALGFGGWVSTARSLRVPDGGSTIRGSLYAYVVGLIAGALGWGILGAMEGVLAGVVDAAVVCWGSEVGGSGREARYCREAGWLFGGDGNQDSDEVRNWREV